MFYQLFFSPQVKRSAIITYKHGIYIFPHELPNDLGPRKLGKIREISKLHTIRISLPSKTKRVFLKYSVNDCGCP